MGDTDQHPRQALQRLDAELTQTLDRVQRVRAELRQILSQTAPTDLPPELAAAIADMGLSDADRSLLVVMSRVLEPALLHAFAATLQTLATSPTAAAFDELPADADEPTRQCLAERLLPLTLDMRSLLPGLPDITASSAAARTIDVAVGDLYSPAQVDVLLRVRCLRRSPRPRPAPSGRHATGPAARSIPMIIF
jgi:hypothetical protein